MTTAYLLEGLDRTGKTSLVEGIQHVHGYHQVIHYEKPKLLDYYKDGSLPLQEYQEDSFRVMFRLLRSGIRLICDRSHLGEAVWAPLYRKYSGDYVFDLERQMFADYMSHVRLILLTEDFSKSKHFVDDGLSLGTADQRELQQNLFVDAFNRSIIRDKKIICVTGKDGQFRSKEDILNEALE